MRRIILIASLLFQAACIAQSQILDSAASYLDRAMQRCTQGELDGASSDFDPVLAFTP